VRIRRHTDGDNTISVAWPGTERCVQAGRSRRAGPPSRSQAMDMISGEWICMDRLMDEIMDNAEI
jgi:hypothetical protein